MRTVGSFALVLTLTTACDPMTVAEQGETDAIVACLEQTEKSFPEFSDGSYELRVGEPQADNFRVGKDGHFVLEMPDLGSKRSSPFLWTCAGNIRARAIQFVEFDGIQKRPNDGISWSF